MTSFFVLGDIMIDTTCFGEVNRLSPEAPIPVLQKRRTTEVLGGAGNVAMNLKAILPEAIVYLEGFLSKEYINLCKRFDIKDNYIIQDYPTSRVNIKLRYIDETTGYQLLRVDNEESAGLFSLNLNSTTTTQHISDYKPDGVILSDYGKGAITRELAEEVISVCVAKGIPTFIDTRREDITCFQRADYITPNTRELNKICKDLKVTTPLEVINKLDLHGILETRGHKGMDLHLKNLENYHVDAVSKEVFDVTGAGDTATAGFAALRVAIPEMAEEEAMRITNILAGGVCTMRGTSTPNYNLREYGIRY